MKNGLVESRADDVPPPDDGEDDGVAVGAQSVLANDIGDD